ncbi:uncharacterized protein K460DRAFT_406788 [Cucurbitaria berberidis CBS 394.84]|uniref:Zn(2)-C6 fungal-type domain-containing protein n=1 Tax=Cucurbitaria berberidis CBS 394.84 TaxID=1168544 RepID=A0A9P4L9V3_9PLEO|nr:uncharacterized protein K460DRAFT_406788 [Cucurbitaria berberidis CBS 394.84]KAF1846589.1 hypothetical protein K460DRAFT_406788 [Cucurbitaria berberidis CBS 394.84]
MDATIADPGCWQGENVDEIEHLLNFAGPVNNGTNARNTNRSRPGRPLACTRCHAQKLRCVRSNLDPHACNRCLSATLECVERRPQRMGRPVDVGTQVSQSRIRSKPGLSQSSNIDKTLWSPIRTGRRQRSIDIGPSSASPSDIRLGFDCTTTPFVDDGASGLEWWTRCLIPEEPSFSYSTEGSTQTVDSFLMMSDQKAEEMNFGLSFVDSESMGLSDKAHVDRLLKPNGKSKSSLESHEMLDSGPNLECVLDDPVEHLSNVHLKLYKCLTLAKSVEKQIKRQLREMPKPPTEPIDTSWSEHLFHTTEVFIKALAAYANGVNPSADNISDIDMMRDGLDTEKIVQVVDTATGLMIVSSYVRLLQIFDVLVLALEKSLDIEFPSGYVQIRFGDFVPTANKAFGSRLLGQYLLHLLNSMSEVVGRIVASRQPYAKAVSDSRTVGAELKERILSLLQ